MFKVLTALLLIPALSFAAPKFLAEKKYPIEADVDGRAALASLYNAEIAREGSPLRKAMADILKEYADQSGAQLDEVEAADTWMLETGGSGGLQTTEYLIPVTVSYKRSVTTVAYLKAAVYFSERDDASAGVTVRIERRAKVSIK